MTAETPRRRERVNVVWKPAHLAGIFVLSIVFIDASTIVWGLRLFLFLYFLLTSLDLILTRYHLWTFQPTTPELKHYALITGATSGLGREMSYLLAEQKYSLVLTARTETILERMRAEIELVNRPVEVLVCVCDLATNEGIEKLIQFIKDKELVIDLLVNNAGVCITKDFTELKSTQVDDLMTLDMKAVVKLTHAIVPQMVKRGVVATNFGKTADIEQSVCMKVPGLAADAKETAKIALDAMFNGEVLIYDTWFSYTVANLVQCLLPGRLTACCFGAGMHELKNVWHMVKR
ncbi:hypothetical protein BBO99_00003202 [Phytophthora kernoviae]|uniref:Ketoreductase (KR) domain-containing protein n=2 Tax=Phytophthora kernoviae TaxID=325452 RepID=A0A3R7J6P7_9STRA|nr:hypothetical protein G195_004804 [Phytophthora kernoviae 00238/432]KAG2525285.1 hypothetical protein JM16_003246 [Phytophthora kernoviae]KAG2526959.1 hypothetical protein JM18_003350 [Phytophthora kernoviae]RLN10936.1 hypothetical protein BBI17_000714 [Phytophthora kernoviae]RLN82030.1 hypothetical protein BBO99_00003202 [Phytophthora kernoviae]